MFVLVGQPKMSILSLFISIFYVNFKHCLSCMYIFIFAFIEAIVCQMHLESAVVHIASVLMWPLSM